MDYELAVRGARLLASWTRASSLAFKHVGTRRFEHHARRADRLFAAMPPMAKDTAIEVNEEMEMYALVEVRGGEVYVRRASPGLKVVIVDYDNERRMA